jgi:hypothetical protein
LLPLAELIEQSKLAVDELIDVLGRASVEAVLRLSAEGEKSLSGTRRTARVARSQTTA